METTKELRILIIDDNETEVVLMKQTRLYIA